jgi:sugar lactone lactonase YvrE
VPAAPSCALGESPRWHEGAWWWVDVPVGAVFRATVTGGDWSITPWLRTGERVSLVHPAGPGRVLVARGGRLEVRPSTRPDMVERTIADLSLEPGWVLGDGIVDDRGAIWIGVIAPEPQRERGWLARVLPDGTVERAVASIRMSNGLALADGGKTLYHADSTRRVVWRHRLAGDGSVASSEEFLRFAADDGMPDGLCLDPEGRLWVAVYGAGEVRGYRASGERVASVTLPVPQSTGVWIGGPDGRDVVVTSGREGYRESDRRAQPLAGTTFTARLPP